jgi:vitamin B12 transporter
MRGLMRGSIVLMIVLASATSSVAQEGTEEQLGTVVVTATRTEEPLESVTNSVSVVSDQDIADRQSLTVSDALRDVPGVNVSQQGSVGTLTSVFIRGTGSSGQTLVLFDGVEVNSPLVGGFNFGNITTQDIGRIEVLRGAGGTLYGSAAIGGVINLITKQGEGPPHFTVSSAGGNIGTNSDAATLSGRSGIVAYSASLGYLTTAGFRPANGDFSNLTGAARIDITPIEHGTLRGVWRSAHSSLGLADYNEPSVDVLDPDARERDEFYLGKLYRVAGAYTRSVSAISNQVTDEEPASGDFYGRSLGELFLAETQVNYLEGTAGMSTMGFEFKEQSAVSKSIYAGSESRSPHSRSNYAGYAQQQVFLLDNTLTAVAGFRVDGNQDFGSEVSASWSLGYLQDWGTQGRWTTHIKGSYAEGFRAPTFFDNAFNYPPYYFANPNLQPEISSEYDGGVQQHLGLDWLSVEGTFFTRRTKNLIDPYVAVEACPSATGLPSDASTACNFARGDVRGVETVLRMTPLTGLDLSGTYTYLDWDISMQPGSSLPATLVHVPHNQMASSVTYRRGNLLCASDELAGNVNLIFVGGRADVGGTDDPMYTRTDLAVRYDLPMPGHEARQLGWFARVQNLFDRNYDEVRGFKSPPINVLAGVEMTF